MLAFADKERFHPLAVEPYLARCDLFRRPRGWRPWPRRAARVSGAWDEAAGVAAETGPVDKGAARARALGRFPAGHHLRFLDPRVRKAQRAAAARARTAAAPPWAGIAIVLLILAVWWWFGPRSWDTALGKGLLIAMGLVLVVLLHGWLVQRLGTDRAGAILSLAATAASLAVVVWRWQDPVAWRRWAVQALAAVLVFAVLQSWSDRSLSHRAAEGLKSLSVAPIVIAGAWIVSSSLVHWIPALSFTAFWAVVLGVVMFDDLMATFMAVFSSLRREASAQAAAMERELRAAQETAAYPYYGRVWREPTGRRVALQYFFFYAFNDWRSHDGLNFHEADWEWATVFLERQGERLVPRQVALSQHHSVRPRAWSEVELAGGDHPVLYVALGSHANYFEPGKRLLPDLVEASWLQKAARALLDSRQKTQQAADDGVSRYRSWIGRKVGERSEERSTADDPTGTGLVIGPARPRDLAAERSRAEWSPVVLDGSQPWVDYRGLWGVHALLRNESGPPGPQWEREENLPRQERPAGRRRELWENPLVLIDPVRRSA